MGKHDELFQQHVPWNSKILKKQRTVWKCWFYVMCMYIYIYQKNIPYETNDLIKKNNCKIIRNHHPWTCFFVCVCFFLRSTAQPVFFVHPGFSVQISPRGSRAKLKAPETKIQKFHVKKIQELLFFATPIKGIKKKIFPQLRGWNL